MKIPEKHKIIPDYYQTLEAEAECFTQSFKFSGVPGRIPLKSTRERHPQTEEH